MIRDYTVNDSSQWYAEGDYAAVNARHDSVMVGTIQKCYKTATGAIKYIVEANVGARKVPLHCTTVTRFGGIQNYEEFRLRQYKGKFSTSGFEGDDSADISYEDRVGDVVLVACIRGNAREGVIIGGIPHPGRKPTITPDDIAYASQFNGIETLISLTGGYKVTNKGYNPAPLDNATPGIPFVEMPDNPLGGTYIELADDFSLTMSDADSQSIVIDKAGKTTTITSGDTVITLNALDGSSSVETKKFDLTVSGKWTATAKDLAIEIDNLTKLKTKKIAIGNDSFELIDGLIKLIDALGTLIVTSPVGPCNPLNGAPTWTQVDEIKSKLNSFKGSL